MTFQEISIFETITEEWFTEYYAKRQQSASIDVRDMNTRITLTNQTATVDDDSVASLFIVLLQVHRAPKFTFLDPFWMMKKTVTMWRDWCRVWMRFPQTRLCHPPSLRQQRALHLVVIEVAVRHAGLWI